MTAQRTPYARNESVWALRRIMLADGTEIAAATKQANMRETEAEKRERLKAERKEMTDALRYARVHIDKRSRNSKDERQKPRR